MKKIPSKCYWSLLKFKFKLYANIKMQFWISLNIRTSCHQFRVISNKNLALKKQGSLEKKNIFNRSRQLKIVFKMTPRKMKDIVTIVINLPNQNPLISICPKRSPIYIYITLFNFVIPHAWLLWSKCSLDLRISGHFYTKNRYLRSNKYWIQPYVCGSQTQQFSKNLYSLYFS